jgi:hypothetical protein
MTPRILIPLLLIPLVTACMMSGCAKTEKSPTEAGGGTWTLTGKTYLIGSPEPVSGVEVACAGIRTVSGQDGSYEIRGIPDGRQTLTAQKAQCDSFSRAFEIHSELTYHIFLTHSTATLSGTIRNSPGEAIEGAKVTLREYTDYTDAAGHYQFSNIPRGAIDTLFVTHPDYIARTVPCCLNTSDIRVNIRLAKEWTIYGNISTDTYVDETLPMTIMYYSAQLVLGTAGYDSLGRYRFSHRNILISFDLPELLRSDSVVLVEANLELRTDAAYPSFVYQTSALASLWDYRVVYNNQPSVGSPLASGTLGDGSASKYWSVLGTSGLRQIVQSWKAGGRFYGVVVQGGTVAGRSFYSGRSNSNRPRVWFKVQY